MGEALFDLEQVLRSKRVTSQETSVLLTCKSEAIKDFVIGASVGAGLTWFATRRVKTFLRINLLAGGAFIAGMWRFGSSLDSSVDHILSLDGSRLQSELANIIVNKYRDNPWGMQRLSKYFYVEEVFEDSHPDRPKLKWRPRNAFIERVDDYKNENNSNGSQSNSDGKQTDMKREILRKIVSATKDVEPTLHGKPRQASVAKMDPGLKTLTDPFDCVFDSSSEEEQLYKTSSNRADATSRRKHKKAHRRRRLHRRHHEDEHN